MGHDTPLSAGMDVIVDMNVFFAIGQPDNPRYRTFRQAIQTAVVTCKLPQRVVGGLGGPETDRV